MSIFLYLLFFYILAFKVWPYFAYPNYFKKSKIENYLELKKVASRLKGNNKEETIRNISNYITKNYTGYEKMFALKSLVTIFQIGDFSTNEILNKKQFLWCHNQNRLFVSLLINTGLFNKEEIFIQKRFFRSLFIHQWLLIDLGDQSIEIDPFYKIFRKVN